MKTETVTLSLPRSRTQDYVALAKPRLNLLGVAPRLAGYVLARGYTAAVVRIICTIAGTGLVAGGASAFNQILERGPDALMKRTKLRPLPDGRLHTREALIVASALSAAGLLIL